MDACAAPSNDEPPCQHQVRDAEHWKGDEELRTEFGSGRSQDEHAGEVSNEWKDRDPRGIEARWDSITNTEIPMLLSELGRQSGTH